MLNKKIAAALLAMVMAFPVFAKTAEKTGSIIIARHGESDHDISRTFNTDPHHPAHTPSYLTDSGKKQVSESAKRMKNSIDPDSITAIYTSPMPRARQTAEIIATTLGLRLALINEEPRLTEIAMGDREGKEHSAFSDKDLWFSSDPTSFGGESVQQANARLHSFISEIKKSSALQEGNVLIVTHGGPSLLMNQVLTPDTKVERLPSAEFTIVPANSPLKSQSPVEAKQL